MIGEALGARMTFVVVAGSGILLLSGVERMASWGPFDIMGYITLFIAAIIMAANAAIAAAPAIRRQLPSFFKLAIWSFVPLALMVISLISFGAGLFANPDYNSMLILKLYGGSGQYSYSKGDENSFVGNKRNQFIVDGHLLQSFAKKNYRLIGVSLHSYGDKDVMDIDELNKSGPHDIVDGDIAIVMPWSNKYFKELIKGDAGTAYYLLVTPATVTEQSFSTLRQAIALGCVVVNSRVGPP